MRAAALAGCAAAALAAFGCGGARETPAVVLAGADTLAAPESELLGVPVDLAVDAAGRVYVLDNAMARVVRLQSGAAPVLLGRRGVGPGELQGPLSFRVDGDTIRVDDRGNGRVVVLSSSGAAARSVVLPRRSPGPLAFGARGQAVVGTAGLSAAGLALRVDPAGNLVGTLGALVAPAAAFWDFTAMKADVRRGRVPAVLRNSALPVLGDGDAVWLVLVADGAVRRYDARGREVWSAEVGSPEVEAIRRQFFALNRAETNPSAFYPLSLFADAQAVGGELWLLVNAPEDQPSSVLVLRGDGTLARRYVLRDVAGARSLAVDRARGRLYLAIPSNAAVVSVPLPAS